MGQQRQLHFLKFFAKTFLHKILLDHCQRFPFIPWLVILLFFFCHCNARSNPVLASMGKSGPKIRIFCKVLQQKSGLAPDVKTEDQLVQLASLVFGLNSIRIVILCQEQYILRYILTKEIRRWGPRIYWNLFPPKTHNYELGEILVVNFPRIQLQSILTFGDEM